MKDSIRRYTLSIFLFILLTLTHLSAKGNTQSIVLINSLDSIIFPIVIPEKIPDTTKPLKPQMLSSIPSNTSNNSIDIEIGGEANTQILVNGRVFGTIDSSGRAIITLDTSGADGTKSFTITLRDKSNNISDAIVITIEKIPDPKFDISYKGLTFYYENLPSSSYQLNQLSDDEFNTLSNIQKQYVANKLLSTLFFGYPQKELQEKIDSGHFIENIRLGLNEDITDKVWLENYIIDDSIFRQSNYNEQEAVDILSRFFAMKKLDSYFINNWVAYTLTQTILFSPAYELDTSHTPNIANVYNRIVGFLNEDSGMRYISYVHMMSEDNWRRFRSPEDNGREMIELFALDEDDTHVLIAGQALQNWKLDSDNDTLVVSLNQNREPLNLFNTIIYNGDDFYRELVKSSLFTTAVTTRLVDHFFPNTTQVKKTQIITSIVSSNPETWRDIMLQIVFSEEYLLHSSRPKSAEELFFSLTKKMEYKHRSSTFHEFKDALENMHQASMKYKLGKQNQVPLDTLSFATYHKFIRERVMLRKSNPDKINNYSAYDRMGWDEHFIDNTQFNFQEDNVTSSLESLVQYLFSVTIARTANAEELSLFHTHMTYIYHGTLRLRDTFNMLRTDNDITRQKSLRESRKRNIAFLVLDYISRLTETYSHMEVK